MSLATTTVGAGEPDVAFAHGLFGQGKNWTQIAKALTPGHTSLLVDMPDHGRSPWTELVDYPGYADLVAETLAPHAPLDLVGHSMGGKIAMQVALRRPELVRRLVVVDIAPADYRGLSAFGDYVAAMRAIDLAALPDREAADEALRDGVPDPVVRGFLLQNLRRASAPENWRWQMNLGLLGDQLDRLGEWPATDATFDGPVLWVAGAESDYVRPEHREAMRALFPRVRSVRVKGAGHWVHSEQPDAFVRTLRAFLDA
ncbi:alpha/beta fold hydrolase [Naumannella huperziae]